MSQPDDLAVPVIERTTDLDMDVDRLWSLISTPDGWKSWLVDDADLVIAPAAGGTAVPGMCPAPSLSIPASSSSKTTTDT